MPPCTEPKLTTAGCFEMLLRRLTTVCAVPTRSAAATIGSTPPHGAEPCVWRPWTSMVNLSDAAISGPPRTAIRPACTDENTCRPNIASGLKSANRPSSSISDAPPSSPSGAPSSEGWNTSITSPGSSPCIATSASATPSRIAVCASWPQACITPVCWPLKVVVTFDANGRSLRSVTGSASMSARSAIFGPGLPPLMIAVTPWWAMPVRGSRPSARRCSATLPAVRSSRLDSSGWAWKSRRQSTTCCCSCCAAAATSGRCAGAASWATTESGAASRASSSGPRRCARRMAVSFGGRCADATAPVAGLAGCSSAGWTTVSAVLQAEPRLKPLLQEVPRDREASKPVGAGAASGATTESGAASRASSSGLRRCARRMAVSFGGRCADATAPVAGMAGCRRAGWKTVSSVLQEELRLKPLLQEVHRDREASERVVEADLALHADLVRRYAPLEEVGQLLHVLQLHERERVARVEVFRHAQLRHALVGAVLQVFAHVPDRQPGDAARQGVLRERDLALHRLGHHLDHLRLEVVVDQVRLLLARGADHLERERHVAAFVAEHPVGARCQPVQQSARAQVVDVGERAEEEQTLDAAGEADQVEQEPAALLARLDAPEVLHAVDPLEAELGHAPDRRDVLGSGECPGAFVRVRQVSVEQGPVALHVTRPPVRLP